MKENKPIKDIKSLKKWFLKHQLYLPDKEVFFWTLSSLTSYSIKKMMIEKMHSYIPQDKLKEIWEKFMPAHMKEKGFKKGFNVIEQNDMDNEKFVPMILFVIDFILRALSTNRDFYDDFFNDVKVPSKILQGIYSDSEMIAWITKIAIDLKILEIGGNYSIDQHRSRGYRICSNHLCDPDNMLVKERCGDETIAAKVLKSKRKSGKDKADINKLICDSPVLLYSFYYLNKLKVNANAAEKALKGWKNDQLKGIDVNDPINLLDVAKVYMIYFSYAVAINRLKEADYHISRDEYGRIHSNLTNFPRVMRPYLFFEGCEEPLYQLDLSNSQPLLLTFLFPEYLQYEYHKRLNTYEKIVAFCKKKGIEDIPIYFDFVTSGKLYPELHRIHKNLDKPLDRSLTGKEKEDIKDLFYKLLFGRDIDIERISEFKEGFEKEFPTVWKVIAHNKEVDHSELSHKLQRIESSIFIDKVLRPLLVKEHLPYVLSIHDCIVCPESLIPVVKQKINEAFAKAKFKLAYATLKVEGLNADQKVKNETVKLIINPNDNQNEKFING